MDPVRQAQGKALAGARQSNVERCVTQMAPAATDRIGDLIFAACVTAVIAFALLYLWPSLFRTWFFNADEYVVAAEVIRFLNLDFRQHFVDMPGTPMMLLAAVMWFCFYAAHCALGIFPMQRGIGEFTFDHMPALFIMLRGMTLFFFILSVILLFVLTARLTNKAAAATAALILGMSPVYALMSSFVRVESLAVCLMLMGILSLLRALDHPSPEGTNERQALWRFDLILLAGVLAGLAAATRLHSITASVPVLALLIILAPRHGTLSDYPRSVRILALLALVVLGGMSLLVTTTWRSVFDSVPHAYAMIRMALFGATSSLLVAIALYLVPRTRRLLIRVLSPDLLRMLLGCGAGLLVGTSTIPRQYPFFLRSMEMYSTSYTDVNRVDWPFWQNAQWYASYYLNVIAPDRILLVLLVIGAAFILIRRDRRLLPFVVGAVLFFVSKPLNLIAAPHHVILWLPFYAIISAYPVGLLYEFLSRRLPYGRVWGTAGFVGVFACLCWFLTLGPQKNAYEVPNTEERLGNILLASSWIKQNTESKATVAVSYYCFNPDVFYVWLRSLDVPVPQSAFDGRTYMIWWGYQSTLKGLAGYVCISPLDIALKPLVDRRSPGEGTDPSTDPRFRLMQSFGKESNQVSVYQFDYR